MWPFPEPRKDIFSKENTICDQIIYHVREANEYKIRMDKAQKDMALIDGPTTLECVEYAHLSKKYEAAKAEYWTSSTIWLFHVRVLQELILPQISIIVNVGGVKYKVTNVCGKLGFYADIKKVEE